LSERVEVIVANYVVHHVDAYTVTVLTVAQHESGTRKTYISKWPYKTPSTQSMHSCCSY